MRAMGWLLAAAGCVEPEPTPRDPWCASAAGPEAVTKGFESGDLEGWSQELAGPWSAVVVDEARCGRHAVRFEIRTGDAPEASTGFRAELHELLDHIAPVGSERWVAFSTLIPESWPDLDNRTVIAQWHATPDLLDGEVWRSPPLAVRYVGGELTVTARASAEPVQLENDAPEEVLYRHPDLEKGVWHDWIFHIVWSWEEDGLVEAWLDGEPVISRDGPVGYNDRVGTWFKWGIYRDDHPETQALLHDHYRRGPTAAAVGW